MTTLKNHWHIWTWHFESDWKPGSDVLLYLKLNSTTTNTDEIGTYTWTAQDVTYDSKWAYFNWTSSRLLWNQNLPDCQEVTIAFRWKFTYSWQQDPWFIFFDWDSTWWYDFWIWPNTSQMMFWKKERNDRPSYLTPTKTIDNTKYYCIITVWDSTWIYFYVDNESAWSISRSWITNVGYHYLPCIWALKDSSSTSWSSNRNRFKWYLSHFVYSNKAWNQTDRNSYYQLTKKHFT